MLENCAAYQKTAGFKYLPGGFDLHIQISILILFYSFLGCFAQGCESCRIIDSHLGKHLSVDLDA